MKKTYRAFDENFPKTATKPLYVIAGPTASGKTAASVALAKLIGGEVVSADSMQIYKTMDIGTAKPTPDEMCGITHHMMDIVMPNQLYSAALYQQQAREVISDIHARNKVPILCGGTGFYINATIYNVQFDKHNKEDSMRLYFTKIAAEKGHEYMHNQLQQADPSAAASIHPNNIKRVIRALSYIQETGRLFSAHNDTQKNQPGTYDTAFFVLTMDRQQLYGRINHRVDAMLDAGLEAEVARLREDYDPNLVSMQGIGYKEIVSYLDGTISRAHAIDAIKQNSRNYAKRQMTWFRNQNPDAINIPVDGKTAEEIANEIYACPICYSKSV